MRIALVCIAKNEDNYIKEWILYHKKLGFNDIFIYQNDWRTDIEGDNIHKFELDGLGKQPGVYNIFIRNFKNEYDWAAFFDVDEFLVLKKHKNIEEFINDYSEFPSIGINWVLFGNNNMEAPNDNYSVLERFTKRQKSVNRHIKTILNLKSNAMMNTHCPINVPNVDCNYMCFYGPFNPKGDDKIAQLNHYFCKTMPEFLKKCERGSADNPREGKKIKDYEEHNFNEIDDFTALNFYKEI